MGIRAEQITKRFGAVAAFEELSLDIEDGSFVALLGATNAGKTTLIRTLAGIERPDTGRVRFDGEDVTRQGVRKRSVSMVYQQFINYPSMTVYENIASPLRVARKSKADIDRAVRDTAELLGLTRVLDHLPEHVSGGQRQRTAIARALVKGAKYIFLDEPLANLDYKLREELRGELISIFRQRGGAVVCATADPLDALAMATHVGFMHEGRLLQYDTLDEVYARPAEVEVASFFSHPAMNLFEARAERGGEGLQLRVTDSLAIDAGSLADALDADRYLVGVRAHALHTQPCEQPHVPVRAEVELAEVVGSDTELHLRHEDQELVVLEHEFKRYEAGETLDVYLETGACYVFDAATRRLIGQVGAA